jgi:IMP cyclohydrolase-like protein
MAPAPPGWHPSAVLDARDHLAALAYPGRGLMVGRTADGAAFELYWITGRSDASRARRAVREGTAVDVRPTGDSGPADPLRHYRAMCRVPGWAVLGNGDHVAPVASALAAGSDLLAALRPHDVEPDALRTPRIVGAVGLTGQAAGPFAVGAARPGPGGSEASEHVVVVATDAEPGSALVVHTYAGDLERVRPDAQPRWAAVGPDLASEVERVWEALEPGVRVLVVGRATADPDVVVALP